MSEIEKESEEENKSICWIILEDFCQDLLTGSGTRSTHLPGRGGGWESESLPVFNTRQESGNGDPSTENWSPDVRLNIGSESETGSRLSGGSYLEMGGVCLAPRRFADCRRLD